MSISILTIVFTLKFKKLVLAHVCGIIFTVNRFLLTSFTVREVPFKAIDPLTAMNLISFSGHSNVNL